MHHYSYQGGVTHIVYTTALSHTFTPAGSAAAGPASPAAFCFGELPTTCAEPLGRTGSAGAVCLRIHHMG